MHKLTIAIAALAFAGGVASAQADDSGHISMNSLNAQQLHRIHGPASTIPNVRLYPVLRAERREI
jgi:hypothetical protein